MSNEKSCSTCRFGDEYFGDCCHPEGGVTELFKAVSECLEKNHAWWMAKMTTEEILESMKN